MRRQNLKMHDWGRRKHKPRSMRPSKRTLMPKRLLMHRAGAASLMLPKANTKQRATTSNRLCRRTRKRALRTTPPKANLTRPTPPLPTAKKTLAPRSSKKTRPTRNLSAHKTSSSKQKPISSSPKAESKPKRKSKRAPTSRHVKWHSIRPTTTPPKQRLL